LRSSLSRELGTRIRAARESARLTQLELATALKVTQSNVSHWESGSRTIDFFMLLTLAHLTERPIEYFVPSSASNGRASGSEYVSLLTRLDPKLRVVYAEALRAMLAQPELIEMLADRLDPRQRQSVSHGRDAVTDATER